MKYIFTDTANVEIDKLIERERESERENRRTREQSEQRPSIIASTTRV